MTFFSLYQERLSVTYEQQQHASSAIEFLHFLDQNLFEDAVLFSIPEVFTYLNALP